MSNLYVQLKVTPNQTRHVLTRGTLYELGIGIGDYFVCMQAKGWQHWRAFVKKVKVMCVCTCMYVCETLCKAPYTLSATTVDMPAFPFLPRGMNTCLCECVYIRAHVVSYVC